MKPESEFSHVRRHEAETDPQDEECGEGRDICIVGGGIWKRKWSDSGAAGSADITDSAGAADPAKTTGSANTTDDAEMAAGTSASGSAGTESKDSAEQEAAGAGSASGAAGNQAEKAAESATKTEEESCFDGRQGRETDSAKIRVPLRKTTPRVRMQR